MNNKMFSALGILVVLLLGLGLTSAYTSTQENIKVETTTELPNPVSPGSTYTVKVNVTNNNGTSINLSWEDTSATSGITATVPSNATLANATSQEYSITYSIPSSFTGTADHKVDLEIFNGTDLIATFHPYSTANYSSSSTTTTSDTLCELEGYTETGNLEITDIDVNNKGDGSDDAWQYLDELEITVDVKNRGDDSIQDVEVAMVILDDKIENGGNDVTNYFDLDDDVLKDIGRLRDNDKESVVFKIPELPSDIDDGTYYMYIMTYENGNEDNQCNSENSGDYYIEFSVESVDYKDSIVVKGIDFTESVDTYCGQTDLEIRAPVYNLGSDKENKILVNLYNAELKIDQYQVIDDLNNGDKEEVSFFINVPENLPKEKYDLDVILSFDWDDRKSDEDPLSYDEENSDASVRLNIIGCTAKAPTIAASLESTAQVGEDLVVKATIKNNGNKNDYIFAPYNYEAWADLVSVTPQTATIDADGTQEVTITLSPKQSGPQTFTIKTVVDGETYNQPVSVRIAEEPGRFDSFSLSMSDNATFYLIVGIIILLILIFIVIIIRLFRRKPTRADF